jgi:hypothetical protein
MEKIRKKWKIIGEGWQMLAGSENITKTTQIWLSRSRSQYHTNTHKKQE